MGAPTPVFWLLIIPWQPPADVSTTIIVKIMQLRVLKLCTNEELIKGLCFKNTWDEILSFIYFTHWCILFLKSIFSICHTIKTASAALFPYFRFLFFINSRFCVLSWAFPCIWDGSKFNEMNTINGFFQALLYMTKKPYLI